MTDRIEDSVKKIGASATSNEQTASSALSIKVCVLRVDAAAAAAGGN